MFALLAFPANSIGSPGDPDPSFGSGGIATYNLSFREYPFQNPWSAFQAVANGPGNRIDAAGESASGEWQMLAAQTSESGALEPSFAMAGYLITTFGFPQNTDAIAELVQPDGSIVLAGPWVMGKLTPSGQVDEHFFVYPTVSRTRVEIEALATTANGDILAAGAQTYGNVPYPAVLERSLPNGEPDPSFGHEGVLDIPLISTGEAKEDAHDVLVLPDGKLIVAGSGNYNAGTRNHSETRNFIWLARLNANGSLDRSFGAGRVDYIDALGSRSPASLLAREPDGRLLLMGSIPSGREDRRHNVIEELAVWGFTAEGQPDRSFGNNGRTLIPSPNPEAMTYARATAVDSEGRPYIVIHQWEAEEGPSRQVSPLLARLTPSGQLDSSYGAGGVAIGPPGISWNAITVDPRGRAVLAGGNGEDALIERLLGDGLGPSPSPPSPTAQSVSGGPAVQSTGSATGSGSAAAASSAGTSGTAVQSSMPAHSKSHARRAACFAHRQSERAQHSSHRRRHPSGCPRRRHRASHRRR